VSRAHGVSHRVFDLRLRTRAQGSGFGVQDLGFRV
jgi:hypothetical protein